MSYRLLILFMAATPSSSDGQVSAEKNAEQFLANADDYFRSELKCMSSCSFLLFSQRDSFYSLRNQLAPLLFFGRRRRRKKKDEFDDRIAWCIFHRTSTLDLLMIHALFYSVDFSFLFHYEGILERDTKKRASSGISRDRGRERDRAFDGWDWKKHGSLLFDGSSSY